MGKTEYQSLRKKEGLSIKQMAEYLCVSEPTVRRYEDGTRTPGGPVNKLYGLLKGNSDNGAK